MYYFVIKSVSMKEQRVCALSLVQASWLQETRGPAKSTGRLRAPWRNQTLEFRVKFTDK